MKNTIAILALSAVGAYTGFSQGEISFNNSSHTHISVNNAIGGAASAVMPDTSTYYFALFSSATATTVAGNGATAEIPPVSLTGFNGSYATSDSSWTFDGTQNMGISSSVTPGIFAAIATDAAGFTQIPGEPSSAYFVVLGWSANIGSTIGDLESFLAGTETVVGTPYIGESAVSGLFSTGTAGSASPPAALISTTSPAIPAFTLGEANTVPEPTSIALGVMGAASLLALRRKKA